MKPYRRAASAADAISLAPRLRPLDLKEIEGMSGLKPVESLLRCVSLSDESHSILVDDVVVAMFGVGQGPGDYGIPWFLCNAAVAQVRLRLIREGRAWVAVKADKYGGLENYCLTEHTESLQFIELLNFTLVGPVEYNGLHWTHFRKEGADV
jgi:hypothetical protein